MITYAGIGARKAPKKVLGRMTIMAAELASLGLVLRTGGADGADEAFLRGALAIDGKIELYLPRRGYNNHEAYPPNVMITYHQPQQAFDEVKPIHPKWEYLKPFVKQLHARNAQIILGKTLNQKVDFVVLWTPEGKKLGGTGISWAIAEKHGIPVFNIYDSSELERLIEYVSTLVNQGEDND